MPRKSKKSHPFAASQTWSRDFNPFCHVTDSVKETKLPLDFVSASAMALTDGGETVQMDIDATGDPPDG